MYKLTGTVRAEGFCDTVESGKVIFLRSSSDVEVEGFEKKPEIDGLLLAAALVANTDLPGSGFTIGLSARAHVVASRFSVTRLPVFCKTANHMLHNDRAKQLADERYHR